MKMSDLRGVAKVVYDICQADSLCCSDDKRLIYRFWLRQNPNITQGLCFAVFSKLKTPETITRARRKLQEEGLCLPTADRSEKRQEAAAEVKRNIKTEKASEWLF